MDKSVKPTHQRGALFEAREDFITQWGVLGSSWGINRTMAQIHALLVATSDPLSTDQVMEELQISRGNAHGNIRELIGWGLIRSVIRKGERKEFFEAEKDVWKMFCIIARERKRREIEPAIEVLSRCSSATKGLKSPEGKAFHRQMAALEDFLQLSDKALSTAARSEQSRVAKLVQKFLS